MKKKHNPKVPGEQFVKLTRELLASSAWRGMSISGRRLLDFLMSEHMRHGGQKNGLLKAPYRQLYLNGIGAHQCAGTIIELETRGLIQCIRQGERKATTYALGWLKLHDGSEPTAQWRSFQDPKVKDQPARKVQNLHVNQHAALHVNQHADGPKLHAKQHADGPKNLHVKQHAPYRKDSIQGGGDGTQEYQPGGPASGEAAEPRCLPARGPAARRETRFPIG